MYAGMYYTGNSFLGYSDSSDALTSRRAVSPQYTQNLYSLCYMVLDELRCLNVTLWTWNLFLSFQILEIQM